VPWKGQILTVQIATVNNGVYVFDARRLNLEPLFDALKLYAGLVIIQNAKFDLKFIYHNYKFWWEADMYDPFIAHRLKNVGYAKDWREKFLGLDRLAAGYLDISMDKEIRNSFQHTTGELTDEQLEYAAQDARILIPLYQQMRPLVLERQPQRILDIEFGLLPVTAALEYNGIPFNAQLWSDIADEKITNRADAAECIKDMLSDYIDWDINLNSWQQLLKAFKALGLDIKRTNKETLEAHKNDHPMIKELLRYKALQKAVSTYGHKYIEHMEDDGRIYANFNQVGTDTGRYSCSGPNLQQIPKEDVRYRHAFEAPLGWLMFTADLSQIEYRLAGVAANEESIIAEYLKEDPDFHQLAADLATQFASKDITRDEGKTMNFSLIFQGGPYRLCNVLGISKVESSGLYRAYWKGFSRLQQYMQQEGRQATIRGYSETFWGRRRYFSVPRGLDRKTQARLAAIRREGGNHPIQGTAADLLKKAMVDMFRPLWNLGAKMVHTVHDEVVVMAPIAVKEEVTHIINDCMIQAGVDIQDVVPTVVNITVAQTWTK
jgi:DNA polymerase-1